MMLAVLCQNTGLMRVILAAEKEAEKSDNSVLGTIVIIGLAVFLFYKWKKNQSINNSKNNNGTSSSGQTSYRTQQENTPVQTQQPQQSIFNRPVGQLFTKTSASNNNQATSSSAAPKAYPVKAKNCNASALQTGGSVILVILIVEIVLCFLPTIKLSSKTRRWDDSWITSDAGSGSLVKILTANDLSDLGELPSEMQSQVIGVYAPYVILALLPAVLLIINWKLSNPNSKLILMMIGGIVGVALCFYGPSHNAEVINKYLSRGKVEAGLTFWGYIVVIGYVALIAYSYVAKKNLKTGN